MKTRHFLNKEQQSLIIKAIEQAELNTSGEIRVHIEPKCNQDVLLRSVYLFSKLKMNNTQLRNGVLIYLAYESRKFAIIGDKGINDLVPNNFWDDTKSIMLEYFKQSNFSEGIVYAVEQVGEKLKKFFPYSKNDINEQPNDISFG